MMNTLKMSEVVFEKENHTYKLYGNLLKGVTPIVKWMFPETYSMVPDDVLKRAADYGSLIHSKLELYDSVGINDEECGSLQDYIALKEKYGIKVALSEYLVDDGQNIASSIDKVMEPDSDGLWDIGDVKTTSVIHVNNVRLQLSIYAYLFELDNPSEKVGRLWLFWLPKPQYGVADFMELERIPSEVCKRIIAAYLNGEDSCQFSDLWNIGEVKQEGAVEELPDRLMDIETEIYDLLTKEKEIAARKEELKAMMKADLESSGVRGWKSEHLSIMKKAGGVRQSVDSKKLKESYPEAYLDCLKSTNFKESVEFKLI